MKDWNALIRRLPDPHFMQTLEWAQIKQQFGWQPIYAIWTERGHEYLTAQRLGELARRDPAEVQAACLVLKRTPLARRAPLPSVLYAPKGPLLNWADADLRRRVLGDLEQLARGEGAIFLKIDPDVVLGAELPGEAGAAATSLGAELQSELERAGWRFSSDQIQFRNTLVIDLRPAEDELLAHMKQKTRYNVRLAQQKGVRVRPGSLADLPALYRMYAETSVRDGFVIRAEEYYRAVWSSFLQSQDPGAEALIADVEGEAVAGLFLFHFAGRAYYVYGMSRAVHREKMANYLLQWEAIQRARARGCSTYDLWGAPEVLDETDGMWGVYRFKQGLGAKLVRTLGAWDYAPRPLWYRFYGEVVPRLLDSMRLRGREQTKQVVGGA